MTDHYYFKVYRHCQDKYSATELCQIAQSFRCPGLIFDDDNKDFVREIVAAANIYKLALIRQTTLNQYLANTNVSFQRTHLLLSFAEFMLAQDLLKELLQANKALELIVQTTEKCCHLVNQNKDKLASLTRFFVEPLPSVSVMALNTSLNLLKANSPAFCGRHLLRPPEPSGLSSGLVPNPLQPPTWEIFTDVQAGLDFSIIMPTHNSKHIERVLFQLNRLNYPLEKFELLIVDDGSAPEFIERVQRFMAHQRPINLRYWSWPKPHNSKVFRAGQSRNLGAANANGSHLVFLDSDMFVPTDYLLSLNDLLKHHDVVQNVRHHVPEQALRSLAELSYENLSAYSYTQNSLYWQPFFKTSEWMALKHFWKYTCSYSLALKTRTFWSVGGFAMNYQNYGFEDTELGYRLAQKGCRFVLNPQVLFHLNDRDNPIESFGQGRKLSGSAKVFYSNTLEELVFNEFKSLLS